MNIGYVAYGKRKGIGLSELKFLGDSLKQYLPPEDLVSLEPVRKNMCTLYVTPHYIGKGICFKNGTKQDGREHMVYQFLLFDETDQLLKGDIYREILNKCLREELTEDDIMKQSFDPRPVKLIAGDSRVQLSACWKPVLLQVIQAAAAGKKISIRSENNAWITLILQILSAKFNCAVNVDFSRSSAKAFTIAMNCEKYKADIEIDDHTDGINPAKGFPDVFDTIYSLAEFLYFTDVKQLGTETGFYQAVEDFKKVKEFQKYAIEGVLAEDDSWQQLGKVRKAVFERYVQISIDHGTKAAEEYMGKVQTMIRGELKGLLQAKGSFSEGELRKINMLLFLAFYRRRSILENIKEVWTFEFDWAGISEFIRDNAVSAKAAKNLEKQIKNLFIKALEEGGAEWIRC